MWDLVDLFDGDRIRRGSNCSRDRQWRRTEEEFVHVVLRAVERKVFEVKNLAHTDANHGNHDPVPGLARNRRFIGPNFAAPRIRTNRGNVGHPTSSTQLRGSNFECSTSCSLVCADILEWAHFRKEQNIATDT